MIRLGLRLSLDGGREAFARLVVTALGVALGVCLLLASFAAMNGVNAQDARAAWLSTKPAAVPVQTVSAKDHVSPLWWLASKDEFEGQVINRIDVAATGPRSLVPPGLSRVPSAGEYYVSPALGTLLRQTPAAELGNRFPGHEVGTIGAAGVPDPDALIVVVGHTAGQLSKVPGVGEVTSLATSGFGSKQFLIVLFVGALALLVPVLVFLATATRLAVQLGLRYHEAYNMIRRLDLDLEQHPTSRVYEVTPDAADALRAEVERIQALHGRSMKLPAAAVQLHLAASTVRILAERGDLDVDPETDSSGLRFVTRASVKRYWIAHHEAKRRTVQPVAAVPVAEVARFTGETSRTLMDLVRAGVLDQVPGRRTAQLTAPSFRAWMARRDPDLAASTSDDQATVTALRPAAQPDPAQASSDRARRAGQR
jgi:hypothetical protein